MWTVVSSSSPNVLKTSPTSLMLPKSQTSQVRSPGVVSHPITWGLSVLKNTDERGPPHLKRHILKQWTQIKHRRQIGMSSKVLCKETKGMVQIPRMTWHLSHGPLKLTLWSYMTLDRGREKRPSLSNFQLCRQIWNSYLSGCAVMSGFLPELLCLCSHFHERLPCAC